MSKLSNHQLINAFAALGASLSAPDEQLDGFIRSEHIYNAWFTPQYVTAAIHAVANMLQRHSLANWLNRYNVGPSMPKQVGLILAGNIPLVGFHDVLCVLAAGHHALIKTSAQDARLIKYVLQKLVDIQPGFEGTFNFVERLAGFDAVIATGSNNTSRYFEYYFGKVPHIIRKNRTSVAVLTGEETEMQLYELGHDIFDYFGLGCRNVSKLLVPQGYDFTFLFESIQLYQDLADHNKYHNNYDYNKAIYLVNRDKHLDNGFLLLKEDTKWSSPLAVLFFEYYQDIQSAEEMINNEREKLQCVVSAAALQVSPQVVGFGQSQRPALWDYADGVDTMEFLANL